MLPMMGQKFVHLASLLGRQPFQHILQVGIGLMAVQLGTLNEAHDGDSTLATAQRSGEQPV